MSKERQAKNAELWAAKRKPNKEKETEATSNNKEWPPKKYDYIKSSGYGKTWVPRGLDQSFGSSRSMNASVTDLQGF